MGLMLGDSFVGLGDAGGDLIGGAPDILDVTPEPRKQGTKVMQFDPEKKTLHRDILHRYALGQTTHEMSISLGVNHQVLDQIISSPLFQSELVRLRGHSEDRLAAAQERIVRLSERAVEKLEQLLESENDRIVLDTSRDLLDRAGLKAVERRVTFDAAKIIESAWKRRNGALREASP